MSDKKELACISLEGENIAMNRHTELEKISHAAAACFPFLCFSVGGKARCWGWFHFRSEAMDAERLSFMQGARPWKDLIA